MFEVETVKDLLAKRFGWLTPEGVLLVCSLHHHYAVLGEKYRDRYRTLVEEHTTSMYSQLDAEQADLAEDEYYHPAMHRFDPENDAARDLEQELYGEGFLRLGIMKVTGKGDALEVYGLQVGIDKNFRGIEFLFDVGDFDRVLWNEPHGYGSRKAPTKLLHTKHAG